MRAVARDATANEGVQNTRSNSDYNSIATLAFTENLGMLSSRHMSLSLDYNQIVVNGNPNVIIKIDRERIIKSVTINTTIGNYTVSDNALMYGNVLISSGLTKNGGLKIGITIPWRNGSSYGISSEFSPDAVNMGLQVAAILLIRSTVPLPNQGLILSY